MPSQPLANSHCHPPAVLSADGPEVYQQELHPEDESQPQLSPPVNDVFEIAAGAKADDGSASASGEAGDHQQSAAQPDQTTSLPLVAAISAEAMENVLALEQPQVGGLTRHCLWLAPVHPWKHGSMRNQDDFHIETDAGKSNNLRGITCT